MTAHRPRLPLGLIYLSVGSPESFQPAHPCPDCLSITRKVSVVRERVESPVVDAGMGRCGAMTDAGYLGTGPGRRQICHNDTSPMHTHREKLWESHHYVICLTYGKSLCMKYTVWQDN